MKITKGEVKFSCKLIHIGARALIVTGLLFALPPESPAASLMPGGGGGGGGAGPTYTPLDSWSFCDKTNWTSDYGYAPVSFTNLNYSYLGNGSSLVVSTNVPAWLQFNVVENDGNTNLTVDSGTVMFWFAPSWSSTNSGGTGPGEYGRLIEAGAYTTNSSFGWWSIYVDDVGANLYFSTQTNDLSGTFTTNLCVPIAWTTNYFHHVALTYSSTNTALYLDGALATNGPPLTVYPGSDVLTNGFFIGSDSNGVYQANGLFNSVHTFNVPVDAGTIKDVFSRNYPLYMINPMNSAMARLSSGGSIPSTGPTPNVITGQGNLQILGAAATCSYGTNAYNVWISNITATTASDGTQTVTFAIEGGQDGYYYDVFVGTSLTSPLSKGYWTWQGQGQHCLVYSLTSLPKGTIFIILGTPLDSDGDGLTDAYENLVSHTDPHNAFSNLDGILDGWEILLGLNPQASNFTSNRANYTYNPADWLSGVTGVKSGTVSLDNEGNVTTVSQ